VDRLTDGEARRGVTGHAHGNHLGTAGGEADEQDDRQGAAVTVETGLAARAVDDRLRRVGDDPVDAARYFKGQWGHGRLLLSGCRSLRHL
jgi:hypothetical protein